MQWWVFTDLDGTLLGHDDYSFEPARPMMDKLANAGIPVIINSSKTRAEIESLRTEMHNSCAFVVENGAAVFLPEAEATPEQNIHTPVILGKPLQHILHVAHQLRHRFKFQFQGFADFSTVDVMERTGLNELQSERAKQRIASEPIVWMDSAKRLNEFRDLLNQHGLNLLAGGRFFHIMGKNDKSIAMAWLLNECCKNNQETVKSIALGDSENDRKMLEAADHAGVVRRADGTALTINKSSDAVTVSTEPAPFGWVEIMEQLYSRLKLGEQDE